MPQITPPPSGSSTGDSVGSTIIGANTGGGKEAGGGGCCLCDRRRGWWNHGPGERSAGWIWCCCGYKSEGFLGPFRRAVTQATSGRNNDCRGYQQQEKINESASNSLASNRLINYEA